MTAEANEAMDELTGRLRRFVRTRVSSREDAEDVIQEAYLRVLRYSAEHEVESQERLLFSAAKNLAVDSRRRHSVRQRTAIDYALLESFSQSWPPADEVVYASQRLRRVEIAVARLPPRCREVFWYNRVDGLSYAQVATHLGISMSAVEKHMARACLLIDAMLNDDAANNA
jgi:RNA polymerase sigma factor (sigma-70 family)